MTFFKQYKEIKETERTFALILCFRLHVNNNKMDLVGLTIALRQVDYQTTEVFRLVLILSHSDKNICHNKNDLNYNIYKVVHINSR
jgi:hypothetical protein